MEKLEEKQNIQITKAFKKITNKAELDIKETVELFKFATKFSEF